VNSNPLAGRLQLEFNLQVAHAYRPLTNPIRSAILQLAADSGRDVHLRASAITALGLLKVTEARGALRDLLTNSETRDVPELARPACLSLMRIDGERAIPDLTDVLKSTSDVLFSWPTAFSGFTLEFATNLPASSWNSNPVSPAIVNGQFASTNAISGPQRFYRLKK
jgi:hypothetical protein